MDLEKQADVITCAKQHFSKTTDGDAELLWEAVKGESLEDVKYAIQQHRLEKGTHAYRPDIKRVASLAAGVRLDRNRVVRGGNERIIDYVRRENRQRYHGMGDEAVLVLHFTQAWHAVKDKSTSDYGLRGGRSFVYGHARMALREIGVGEGRALALARECIELEDGEQLPTAQKTRDGELRRLVGTETLPAEAKSWDALKALAVAEHDAKAAM